MIEFIVAAILGVGACLAGFVYGMRTAYRIGEVVSARLSYDAWAEGYSEAVVRGQTTWVAAHPENPYAVDGKRP